MTDAMIATIALVAGIKSREDVLKMGIDKYNEECRSIVMRCEMNNAGEQFLQLPGASPMQENVQQLSRAESMYHSSLMGSISPHTSCPARASLGTLASGRRQCTGWGAGLTLRTTTRRWTRRSWRAYGGLSPSCTRKVSCTAVLRWAEHPCFSMRSSNPAAMPPPSSSLPQGCFERGDAAPGAVSCKSWLRGRTLFRWLIQMAC